MAATRTCTDILAEEWKPIQTGLRNGFANSFNQIVHFIADTCNNCCFNGGNNNDKDDNDESYDLAGLMKQANIPDFEKKISSYIGAIAGGFAGVIGIPLYETFLSFYRNNLYFFRLWFGDTTIPCIKNEEQLPIDLWKNSDGELEERYDYFGITKIRGITRELLGIVGTIASIPCFAIIGALAISYYSIRNLLLTPSIVFDSLFGTNCSSGNPWSDRQITVGILGTIMSTLIISTLLFPFALLN